MTEYDYSPDAWERYIATQDRIARWVDGTKQQPPCNAFTPATPHVQALALKEQERRRRKKESPTYNDDEDDSDVPEEYKKPRSHHHRTRTSHRKPSSTRRHKYTSDDDLDSEYVFVLSPPNRPRAVSHFTRPRRGPPNLTLDLAPFPTSGAPPQDPFYRYSGHSSHSSNTTTPTSVTPTNPNGMAYQIPITPYSAPPVNGRGPVLGGIPSKPLRSQTMPISPMYMQPPPPYYQNPGAYQQMGMGYSQPVVLPLRPGMKDYASYGPDASKTGQTPWTDYIVPASPTSTKPPSLLKRMFTGLTSSKHQQSQQRYQYPQNTTPQSQPMSPPKATKPPKEKEPQMFFGGGGSKRMTRKRSESF